MRTLLTVLIWIWNALSGVIVLISVGAGFGNQPLTYSLFTAAILLTVWFAIYQLLNWLRSRTKLQKKPRESHSQTAYGGRPEENWPEYNTPEPYTPETGPKGTKGELAGTFADDRAETIKTFCSPREKVILQRDPGNSHDSNAITVSVIVGGKPEQIGFIKAKAASRLAPKMDNGTEYGGYIHRIWAPEAVSKPNVTIAWFPVSD